MERPRTRLLRLDLLDIIGSIRMLNEKCRHLDIALICLTAAARQEVGRILFMTIPAVRAARKDTLHSFLNFVLKLITNFSIERNKE